MFSVRLLILPPLHTVHMAVVFLASGIAEVLLGPAFRSSRCSVNKLGSTAERDGEGCDAERDHIFSHLSDIKDE